MSTSAVRYAELRNIRCNNRSNGSCSEYWWLGHSTGMIETSPRENRPPLLLSRYNKLEGILPSWTAIELATLQSSIEAQVPAVVEEQVACADAEVLQALALREGCLGSRETIRCRCR
jgi:hypothetical protein